MFGLEAWDLPHLSLKSKVPCCCFAVLLAGGQADVKCYHYVCGIEKIQVLERTRLPGV